MSRLPRREFLIAAAGSVVAPNALHEFLKLLAAEDIPPERIPELAAKLQGFHPSALQAILAGPAVTFEMDEEQYPEGAIRPGQPVSFRWGVHDWRLSGAPSGSDPRFAGATAKLIFNDDSDAPIWSGTNRTPNLLASRLPREFYRLGHVHVLQLEVKLTPTSQPLIARPTVRIVADELPNWMWPVGEQQSYRWKESYTMHGRIRNNARFSDMRVQPVLNVNTGSEPPVINPTTYTLPAIPIALGATVEASFGPPIAWTWSEWAWFNSFLFTTTGNTSRIFRYTVSFIATDDYSNAYPPIFSTPRDIIIYVALSKTLALASALTAHLVAAAAVIAAIACAIAGPPYGWVAAAWWVSVAATAESVAQVFGAVALDPPELDMRYMDLIPLPQKEKPSQDPKGVAGAQAPSLPEFLAYAQRVAGIPLMMSLVQGKLMGAYQAQDKAGIELQTGSYVKALQAMISDTEAMMKLVPTIQKELGAMTLDPKFYDQAAQSLSKGFPAQLNQELDKTGLDKEGHQRLEKAMENPDFVKQAMNLTGVVEKCASAVGELTVEVRQESVKALQPPKKKGKS